MIHILGMGWSLAQNEIDNAFLHAEVGLEKDQAWVDSRLGIERRFSVLPKEYIKATKNADPLQALKLARAQRTTPITLGAEAARMALRRAGIGPEKIGWVVANNDTPFETVPAAAHLIARELGVGSGPHTDLNNACSSFARHMKLLDDAKEERLPEFVLCVQASAFTVRTDYSPKCVDGYIMGDGAAAQVLSARHPGPLKVEPLVFETDSSRAGDIVLDGAGHFRQEGAAVREFSIRKTCELFEAMAGEKGLYAEEVYTVAHQANFVMQNSILGHLQLPVERHWRNVREQGNIAGAGCPSVLAQNYDKLRRGDKLLYAVVGAGLAWGGGMIEAL